VTSNLHQKRIALIHKRLAMLQRNESLSHCKYIRSFLVSIPRFIRVDDAKERGRMYMLTFDHCCLSVIPALLHDTAHVMERWQVVKAFDPFEKTYEVCSFRPCQSFYFTSIVFHHFHLRALADWYFIGLLYLYSSSFSSL
jgi:hypothetical protein